MPSPTDPVSPAPRSYTAFLSYRHADNKEEGRRWAEWLHQFIETYEVPADLIGTLNLRSEPIPSSLYPVFRDEEELPADADLSDNINRALEHSALLIVLCSPRACESKFVADEIRTFKQLGKSSRILALLLDGEPNARDTAHECLPEPLRFGRVADDGTLDWSQPCEPIAADVRPDGRAEQGYTSSAAYRLSLERTGLSPREARQLGAAYEERLQLARSKIVAGLLGVPLGQLRNRDAAHRLKKARRRQAIASAVAVFALLLTAFALWQRHVAEQQRNEARSQEAKVRAHLKEASRSDTAAAQARLTVGDWRTGLAQLSRAITYDPENQIAQQAFWLALRHGTWTSDSLPVKVFPQPRPFATLSVSPDGKRAVTTSMENVARVWDVNTWQPAGFTLAHEGGVTSAAFSPNGQHLVTTSRDKTARLWDAATGQPMGDPMLHDDRVEHAQFNSDGTRLITAAGSAARVWIVPSGRPLSQPIAMPKGIWRVALHGRQDSKPVFATADDNGPGVTIWKFESGRAAPMNLALSDSDYVISLSFSPDGTRLLTAGRDGSARLWDVETGQRTGPELKHGSPVTSAGFSADGTRIFTTSMDSTARLWDARTGLPIGPALRHDFPLFAGCITADGTRFVAAAGALPERDNPSRGGEIRVWDLDGRRPLDTALPHATGVYRAVFSHDGRRAVTITDTLGFIWDLSTLQRIAGFQHQDTIQDVSFSPDDSLILTASLDRTAALWNARTGARHGPPLQHEEAVYDAIFSADGAKIVTTTNASSSAIRVWDVKSGAPLPVKFTHPAEVFRATFSPDARRVLAAAGTKAYHVWDIATGQLLPAPAEYPNYVKHAAFSPDGTRIVTATTDSPESAAVRTGEVRVWNAATGAPMGQPMPHPDNVFTADFSPDGRFILSTAGDHSARLWDAASGSPIGQPLRHPGEKPVLWAGFSSDGSRVLTAGDHSVQLWLAVSGQALGMPLRHENVVQHATFSPDGAFVLSAGDDSTARLWDIRPARPIGADSARALAALCAGAEMDPDLGSVRDVSASDRLARWKSLQPVLAGHGEWLFLAHHNFPRDPLSSASPRHPLTVRDAASRLLATGNSAAWCRGEGADWSNPLLPFAFAAQEIWNPEPNSTNRPRAAWLVRRGLDQLPPAAAAEILRAAARHLAPLRTVINERDLPLSLLDRAAQLQPEDTETQLFRAQLQ